MKIILGLVLLLLAGCATNPPAPPAPPSVVTVETPCPAPAPVPTELKTPYPATGLSTLMTRLAK